MVETLGSWAPMGLDLIKDVGSRLADITGEKRWTSWLFQRISIIIQQGNAACILGTVATQENYTRFMTFKHFSQSGY